MSQSRRLALSISSWFCIPEQGMKDLEILCRASAFLMSSNSSSDKFPPRYHIVTVSHAIAPWRWPKYYSNDWLQFVNEKHTHYSVELRLEDGSFLTQSELIPKSYHHPTRDLAVLHLAEEPATIDLLKKLNIETNLRYHSDDYIQPEPGNKVWFHGHMVARGNGGMNTAASIPSNQSELMPIPKTVSGSIYHRTSHQIFATTDSGPLVDGMCGGPVLCGTGVGDNKPKLCGLVEGIVPLEHPDRSLCGKAVFVEYPEMNRFLNEIEMGRIDPLVGGDAAEFVGKDQDPEKMDWTKVL